ncbi:MAG: bifunctional lysylphosphatidylglycerol flippase/synthetase MprF [Alkalispirochaeta sp.]
MNRKLLRHLSPVFGFIIFAVAAVVLYHELKIYHPRDIWQNVKSLPVSLVLPALILSLLSYAFATGYDFLASRYAGKKIPYGKTALASFISNTFANSMGFGLLTGGSMRMRMYSSWGLSIPEISKLIVFYTLSVWLGFFTLGGVVLSLERIPVPSSLHLPINSLRPLGFVFLLLVFLYVIVTVFRKKPLEIANQTVVVPPVRTFLFQTGISILDWICAGSALFVLLKSVVAISFPTFFGIYMVALIAIILSQVPGGLGVFETVFVVLLSDQAPASSIIGILLVYRAIYYIIPLLMGLTSLGLYELSTRKEHLDKVQEFFSRWSAQMVPRILAFVVFLSGAVLLFSGATPALEARINILTRYVPLAIVESSHFLASIVGILLVLTARAIVKRIDSAYFISIALLVTATVLSLLKGLDYEEAAISIFLLLMLLPARRQFYRKSTQLLFSADHGWNLAIVFVVSCSIWLTFFSYKHVEYSNELWWIFAVKGHASRSLRAIAGVVVVALLISFGRLLRPAYRDNPSESVDWDRVRNIVNTSENTDAKLALLGDKRFVFSKSRRSFIMFGLSGRSWISMGDPCGDPDETVELLWKFKSMADKYGAWPVFYEVAAANVHRYLDMGLSAFSMGEEARVPLNGFNLSGSAMKQLRYTCNHLRKEGLEFQIVPAESVPQLLPELKTVSDEWLDHKNTREKGFSLGLFDEAYLSEFPVAIVKSTEGIVAFCNVWLGGGMNEISVDLMRYRSNAHKGIMDFLFVSLMVWGSAMGYRWFNLGMAPLSGLDNPEAATAWNRLGTLVYRNAEHFYHFQGLRQYKEKFHPVWVPRYLASPGGFSLPRILADIASLQNYGLMGVLTK